MICNVHPFNLYLSRCMRGAERTLSTKVYIQDSEIVIKHTIKTYYPLIHQFKLLFHGNLQHEHNHSLH